MPESHGMARRSQRHPLYVRWVNIKQRCHNPRHPRFPDYGGRGIFLHPPWHVFSAFLEYFETELGFPSDWSVYSIDRIDVDRGYEPGNLRWATASEQRCNQRLNAAARREQYATPWPFGVLSVDKDSAYGGTLGYLQEMLEAVDRGEYWPTPDEEDWLDRHEPDWRPRGPQAATADAAG